MQSNTLELLGQGTMLFDPTSVHISYCICPLPKYPTPIVAEDPETATVLTGERNGCFPVGQLRRVSSLLGARRRPYGLVVCFFIV